MNRISREQTIFSFSKNNKPVLHIQSGEQVQFETFDCFSNQITTEQIW